VLVPLSRELPLARVDLPRTVPNRARVAESLKEPYGRHARGGSAVALVCVSESRGAAEAAGRQVADALGEVGVAVPLQLWATERRWVELTSGHAGSRAPETATRIAAEAVIAGSARPAASREALGESLSGDREPIASILESAVAAAERSDPTGERNWALGWLNRFHDDGNRPSDEDAARLLVALASIEVRDALWDDMSRANAASHAALWGDLTRRGPDEVRAPAASMLAFAHWLDGNGAKAWCALDQVPAGSRYPMASLMATVLQHGVHPSVWEQMGAAGDVSETYTPHPSSHRHERMVSRSADTSSHRPPSR
jgi:hypothetical protein